MLRQPTLHQALTRVAALTLPRTHAWVAKLQSEPRTGPSLSNNQPFMALDPIPAHTAFRCGAAGVAYNEAAFRHFLAVERRRVTRSSRSLLLVLVSLQSSAGPRASLTSASAGSLFEALGSTVREVDFVGWYHEGRVAAAVMAQAAESPMDSNARVATRVTTALRGKPLADLPFRVRVVRLGGGRAG